MPGLRPGWSFPEHVAPDRATGCSRKAPGLSPGSSERHQEGQVSGGRMPGEARKGKSPSQSHSQSLLFFPLCFQIWFLVQTPQQPPATAPPPTNFSCLTSQHTPPTCACASCPGDLSAGLNGVSHTQRGDGIGPGIFLKLVTRRASFPGHWVPALGTGSQMQNG